MRAAPDDEFKLRFPVAKDRTLRRIAILRIVLTLSLPIFFIMAGVSAQWSRHHDPRWPDIYGEINPLSIYYLISLLLFLAFLVSIVLLIVINIRESSILVRRYGWRAMSDPIEAQRVAMREALYDVATGSTRPDVELEHNGDRIMVVPVRRLRPVGARLELTAEREKAQTPHSGS